MAKALAFISGNTKKISQRSILCSIEGYVTYMVKCPVEYQAPGFIFSFLRRNASERLSDAVKGMRRVSKRAAVFDVPEEYKDMMDRLVADTENRSLKGYEVILVNSMEMLEEEDES